MWEQAKRGDIEIMLVEERVGWCGVKLLHRLLAERRTKATVHFELLVSVDRRSSLHFQDFHLPYILLSL